MGIDVHTLKFLLFASKRQILGRVATIGRMGLHVPKVKLRKLLNLKVAADYGPYCEEFLKAEFSAVSVDSFDISDYEGATHLADMNKPFTIENSYDTILDGGSLEHIYNVPQALINISAMCAQGGQIIHILPANNLCGHGFWQFSPGLFLSLYCESNGYDQTQVFLADVANENDWYEVRKPRNGKRVEIVSSASVFVLVRTRKLAQFSHENVHQSDYVNIWNGKRSISTEARSLSQRIEEHFALAAKRTVLLPVGRFIERKWQRYLRPMRSLSTANPHLVKRAIDTLI
jgi:hypothetical protein